MNDKHTNKRTETHACDLISRQDAIKLFTELWDCIGTIGDREEWEDVCVTTVNEIKSAQPEHLVKESGGLVKDLVNDTISRQAVLDAIEKAMCEDGFRSATGLIHKTTAYDIIRHLPPAQPERVWTPCHIPPEHHKDVIVRGIEAIGNVTVHNIMQWDVDRWRPENYAPSIIWLEWCEI